MCYTAARWTPSRKSSAARSWRASARAFVAAGWRFRTCDRRYPGHPDVVVPRAHTFIEVRGCFWHRHGCAVSSMPKSNVEFWTTKWANNVRRDRRHEADWKDLGWNVILVWECALRPVRREETLVRICQALDASGERRTRP